jgi:hypothetical protein
MEFVAYSRYDYRLNNFNYKGKSPKKEEDTISKKDILM